MMSTLTVRDNRISKQVDFLPLLGTDHIEFYVGNAKQAAHYYKSAFGFKSLAYAGPETGMKNKVSYVLQQNKLIFVFTTALRTGNNVADHVYLHGDGIKILALRVDDAVSAWEETITRGAKNYLEPVVLNDEFGEVKMSGIYTYGETVHLFVERKNYDGAFMPGYKPWNPAYEPPSTGLQYVDHCVGMSDGTGWNRGCVFTKK